MLNSGIYPYYMHLISLLKQMSATELWQWVHSSYGDELGLTSDDDDYVAPSTEDDAKTNTSNMHSDRACDSSSINTNLKLYTGDSMEVSTRLKFFVFLKRLLHLRRWFW